MAAPVGLRDYFNGSQLRALAKKTKDAAFARRLLALAEIYDGARAATRPASAASGSRRSATGSCVSMPKVPTV